MAGIMSTQVASCSIKQPSLNVVSRTNSHRAAGARHQRCALRRIGCTEIVSLCTGSRAVPFLSSPCQIRSRGLHRRLEPAQVTAQQASEVDTEATSAPQDAAERAEPAESSTGPPEPPKQSSAVTKDLKTGRRQEFEKSWRQPFNRNGAPPHARERWNPTGPPQRFQPRSPPIASEPVTDVWFKRGDVVTGKIVWANEKGARVSLLKEPRILGYMPAKQGPYLTRSSFEQVGKWSEVHEGTGPCLPVGLIRDFLIMNVPLDMSYESKGPLLSAQALDLDTLWARAVQMVEVCYEDKENFQLKIEQTNQGGLIGMLESLQAFIPYSHVPKDRDQWFSDEELAATYTGKVVEATITEVKQDFRKVVMSMTIAEHNKAVRGIKLGSLVWGEVRKINDFGCFVGLCGTKISGLLHISNISRARVERVEDCFQEGDRIRALVVGMDDGYARISLSTAELEEHEGDMIVNAVGVFENAEKQAEDYNQRLAAMNADDYNNDNYDGDYMNNGRLGAGPTDTLDWAS